MAIMATQESADHAGPPGAELGRLNLSLEDLSSMPLMEDGGATAAGEGAQGGAARAHTPPGRVQHPMPNVDYLKISPAVIEKILAQVPNAGLPPPTYVLLFDENSDGTLSSGETSKRKKGSPQAPLKSISVVKTPAQGLKCPGRTNPRPQCQWPYGVVIIDNRPVGVGAQAAPYATMQISRAHLATNIATWRNQKWKDEPDTPGLQVNYYTPLLNDALTEPLGPHARATAASHANYNDKHRCTVFRRKAEPEIYMVLIHTPKGNNIGKALKKPKKRTHEDSEDELRSMQAKLAKISNEPTASTEQKARAASAALVLSVAPGTGAGPAAPAGAASDPEQGATSTYRGDGGGGG